MEDTLMDETGVADAHNAAMMDSNMDATMDGNLDDLFGEAADGLAAEALAAVLPPAAPLPGSLVSRIMDMQTKGCCTKLAWACTGSVAQIKDSGRKIVFRALMRNLRTGAWKLTSESKFPIEAPDGVVFEHIQFSGIGIDMAVVDNRGFVSVYALVGALGRMRPNTDVASSPGTVGSSDLDAVVCLHWLPLYPTEFKVPFVTSSVKLGENWETEMRLRDSNEPSVRHAVDGRHALLYVTRDARLTLMYQNDVVWQSISARLANINSSHDLLSHAAMGQDGATLLLVTHDLGRRFRLYKISITWNPTQQGASQGGVPNMTVAPTLEIGHLTTLAHVAPQQAGAAKLSKLQLLPRTPPIATEPNAASLPTVLAVFTRATSPSVSTQQAPEAFSVIARWNIETVVPTLHGAFAKLKVKGKANSSTPSQNPITVLRRQEDNITNKVVLSVYPQYYGTTLAFGASDGTIEFRDRITLTSIEPYGDTTTISGLPMAGFEQMMTEHHAYIAMSADGSVVAMVKADGSVVSKMMTLRYSWHPLEDGISDTHGLIEAAIVSLAREYTILACCNNANDEILALLPYDLSTELRVLFIREIIKTMQRFKTLDISMSDLNKQQMNVLREPLLPRALSAQFVIGCQPGTMERNFAGKFAFAFLNMRVACTAIAQVVARPDPPVRPDFLVSLRGNIKWGSDFLAYLLAYLVDLRRKIAAGSPSQDAASIVQAFKESIAQTQSPVLHLLLCTWTRCYIRFLANFIPRYLTVIQSVRSASNSVRERQLLDESYENATHLPFKFATYLAFVTEVDAAVREAYTTQAVGPERRSEIELGLIVEPEIPAELHDVVKSLIDTALSKFVQTIDQAALYFKDTSWIGVEAAPPALTDLNDPPNGTNVNVSNDETDDGRNGGGVMYDVIRKLPIPRGAKLRRCRRCPAVCMEDPGDVSQLPSWLAHAQRHCVCGNYWIVG